MKLQEARQLIKQTFENPFRKEQFTLFVNNLLKDAYEEKPFTQVGAHLPDAFAEYIRKLERIGKYQDEDGNIVDILLVELKKHHSIEWARTTQRNFIRRYLNGSRGGELKDAALVAFYTDGAEDWRFSLIKMQYSLEKKKDDLTPAKRFSFLVGKNEKSHTAQKQLANLLTLKEAPLLSAIESSFNIETVTKEFFEKYKELFLRLSEHLENELYKNKSLQKELENKHINHISFTKKLLGQIVFLYFIQKKGWLGVPKDSKWGEGDKRFLRTLLEQAVAGKQNFFTEYLQYLFYEALAEQRKAADPSYYKYLDCKIPFLNGGLFEADYDWRNTTIKIPNELFTNGDSTKEGDTGNGILDVFDRYNFTVKEDEPLEKEVAVDPEMLGKVFENLLEVKDRKSKGAFYTPREIVHYMCRESLINYLDTSLNSTPYAYEKIGTGQGDLFGNKTRKGQLPMEIEHGTSIKVPRHDLERFMREGISAIDNDTRVERKGRETDSYFYQLPEAIRINAIEIDIALETIRICDPAIGSGAFPVGIMNEIVKAREILSTYLPVQKQKDRTPYELKRHCIQECIYGVDIDHSAIDIAKLRLWLSLVVDEDDFYKIKPLPNLDYKIVEGNSLIGMSENTLKDQKLEDEIQELKVQLFDETNKDIKNKLRDKISKKIRQLLDSAEQFSGHRIEFDFRLFFSEVFHEKAGFDIVIGNPPYVGERGNEKIFQEISRIELGRRYYTRWMDYFYFFFHKGIDLLRPKGILSFITTSYFITATGGVKLRADFKQRTTILSLINFNELKIFDSATGQHNAITILSKTKDKSISARNVETRKVGSANPELTIDKILSGKDNETDYLIVSQDELYEGKDNQIRIKGIGSLNEVSSNIAEVLQRMKKGSVPLDSIARITPGIVTLSDTVSAKHISKFQIEAKKGEGIYVINNKELSSLQLEAKDKKEFIKPFFKNSDIGKYECKLKNENWLIYVRDEGKPIQLPTGLMKHFEKYKPVIVGLKENFFKNEIAASVVKKWFAHGNYFVLFTPKKQKYFNGPKIVVPYRSKSNSFCYNDTPWFASKDVVYILTEDKSYDLKYILAILNSQLIFKWLYNKGKRKGETLELYTKPLGEIPVVKADETIQKKLIQIVDNILNEKAVNQSSSKVVKWERQIDIIIYHLYKLTYADAKIVDPELSQEEFEKYIN